MKEELADQVFERKLKEKLKEYEDIIKWGNELAKDGLTKEEKDEIRRKKIEIERGIINDRTPSSV